MKFSFTSLGIASAIPIVNRNPSAHVLNVHERFFLIDCGEGVQMQLRRFGFSFMKIQNIFISHIHGDHIFGLFGLLSTMSMMGRREDIFIYAPSDFRDIKENLMKNFGQQFKFNVHHIPLVADGLNLIYNNRVLNVFSFPLNHRIETFGFLFREKMPKLNVKKSAITKYNLSLKDIAKIKTSSIIDPELSYLPWIPRSFAYCSDTSPFDNIVKYIEGVDLLYHEATFLEELSDFAKDNFHSTSKEAALIAKRVNAKKLLMGHFSARYKRLEKFEYEAREIFPESYIAHEGIEFEVELIKNKEDETIK